MRFRARSQASGTIPSYVSARGLYGDDDAPLRSPTLEKIEHMLPRGRRRSAVLFIVTLLAFTLAFIATRTTDVTSNIFSPSQPSESQAGFLHLLLPAPHANVSLCKSILTAGVLGYPTPIIINWQKKSDLLEGFERVQGVLHYLQRLDKSHDDDVVLLIDAYDVWFQIKPEVLLDRWYKSNEKANKRIRKRLGRGAIVEHIKQDVIFVTQKGCWPGGADDIVCYAVPESTLPRDVYGTETDSVAWNEENIHLKFRPQYLNSGISVGTVAAMRKLLERVSEKWLASPYENEQDILAEIFAHQEYQREVIRSRHLSSLQRLSNYFRKERTILDPHPTRHTMEHADGSPYEYNLGLDYEGFLGQVTQHSEHDSGWIVYNDPESIHTATSVREITSTGVTSLQADIAQSRPPYSHLAGANTNLNLPADKPWEDTSLYTNLWTGVTPAMLHLNTYRGAGYKSLTETLWREMWYHDRARVLLEARGREPTMPIATTNIGKRSEKVWWDAVDKSPVHVDKKGFGAQPDSNMEHWLTYGGICNDVDQGLHIFADFKGKFQDPEI